MRAASKPLWVVRLVTLAAAALVLAMTTLVFAAGLKAGTRAPDFELKDLQGKTLKLSALKGKVVVVDFWATWCAPCKKELPELDKLQKAYTAAGKDVVIIAINIDKDPAKAEKFLKERKISALMVLFDKSQAVAPTYDPPTMPTSYVIDKKGLVRFVNQAYEPGDEKKLKEQIDGLLK
jgi:thiol-disulfide isomerase/thioredoxin